MSFATINPTTGETVATFPELTAAELETKLAAAATAFRIHRRSSFADRAAAMVRAAEIFEKDRERLARLMALEMGKPVRQGRDEAAKCAAGCRFYAEHAERLLADEPIEDEGARSCLRFEPLGAVLAIMPWNFPFWQVVRFAAPTLMGGNVGLLKHAANVPQCAAALEEIFLRAGFAQGCFQNLAIETKMIEAVLGDPRIVAVTLTGSCAAGRAVAEIAGRKLKRSLLELGGSDPFVVMPSAPLEPTVRAAVQARVQNNGQSCIAAKRFIVHAAVYNDFAGEFTSAFRALRVGDPLDPQTEVGPLAQARAVGTLERQVREAGAAGGQVLAGGGRRPGPGFFFEPTVLAEIPRHAAVGREEFFGPVALLYRARDFDEAMEIANDTPFGLGASLWTRDPEEQRRGIAELEAGQVFVNTPVASRPALPFGGIKESGYGRELGVFGLREFMNVKSVRMTDGRPD